MRNVECVCGHRPPEFPNPDCERCGLVSRVAEVEAERDKFKAQRDAAAARLVVEESWRFHGDGDWIWPLCAENVRRNLTVDPAEAARLGRMVFDGEGADRA